MFNVRIMSENFPGGSKVGRGVSMRIGARGVSMRIGGREVNIRDFLMRLIFVIISFYPQRIYLLCFSILFQFLIASKMVFVIIIPYDIYIKTSNVISIYN